MTDSPAKLKAFKALDPDLVCSLCAKNGKLRPEAIAFFSQEVSIVRLICCVKCHAHLLAQSLPDKDKFAELLRAFYTTRLSVPLYKWWRGKFADRIKLKLGSEDEIEHLIMLAKSDAATRLELNLPLENLLEVARIAQPDLTMQGLVDLMGRRDLPIMLTNNETMH